MRAMPIRIFTGKSGREQLSASFRKNRKHYVQEGLGLAIFMIAACFFAAMIYSEKSAWYHLFPNPVSRNIGMGLAMGGTALFIFYSKWTAPSGSHINPAVTITFLRLSKMCRYDAVFFILFQIIGGLMAVVLMQFIMGDLLTAAPVHSVVTVPGAYGKSGALIAEFIIAFITMSMVLFTSGTERYKKYTRIFSALLVCSWVILAGPVSGFGMNPARSLASALPAGIWTSFWIYLFIPFAGMLLAAEFYLFFEKKKVTKTEPDRTTDRIPGKFTEPFEFVL